LRYDVRRLAHDSTTALKTLTENETYSYGLIMPFGWYGNTGKERRDAKRQARRFGGIGQAGGVQKSRPWAENLW
jgi:hypothetical protein